MDLIVPLSNFSQHEDEELRFMLRSVWRNYEALGKVFVVGHRPVWLQASDKVVHIPFCDSHPSSKDVNIMGKVRHVCSTLVAPGANVLVNSDDQIFCRPVSDCDLTRVWLGHPRSVSDAHVAGPKSLWHLRLLSTLELCRKMGWTEHVFEVHVPYVVRASRYVQFLRSVDWKDGNGFLTHAYFNFYLTKDSCDLPDPEPMPEHWFLRFKWRKDVSVEDAREAIRSKVFINFDDMGYTPGLRQALQEKFPHPAPWEAT